MMAYLFNSGDLPNVELTEKELELVAGGTGGFVIPIRKSPANPDEGSGIDGMGRLWQKMGLLGA